MYTNTKLGYYAGNIRSKLLNEQQLQKINDAIIIDNYHITYLFTSSTDNLADIIALFYKLVCDEKKSKCSKPKVAPKPILGDNKHQITKEDLPQVLKLFVFFFVVSIKLW